MRNRPYLEPATEYPTAYDLETYEMNFSCTYGALHIYRTTYAGPPDEMRRRWKWFALWLRECVA